MIYNKSVRTFLLHSYMITKSIDKRRMEELREEVGVKGEFERSGREI